MNEETERLLNRWLNARNQVGELKSQLNRATTELNNATNALGKHLAPKDAKPEETFCVWHENTLYEVYHPKRVWHYEDGKGDPEERPSADFAIRVRDQRKSA